MIANLDHNVGRVLDWLEENDLAKSTLVAFFSDHGELAGSHGHFGKYRPYDESIRIPLLLRLPGTLPAGTVYQDVVSGIDLFATCAGLCGVPLFAGQQGIDHSRGAARRYRGCTSTRLWCSGWGRRARPGTTAIPIAPSVPAATRTAWGPTNRFRLLFDNDDDGLQLSNLFGRRSVAAVQAQLHRRLCNAVTQSGEPLPEFLVQREAWA